MKKHLVQFLALVALVITISSCGGINKSMREANTRVNFVKSDFTLSDQVTGEASSTRFLTIDWARLFKANSGSLSGGAAASMIDLASIPVIGSVVTDKTSSYALYELMQSNSGYDVVFYPQFETKVSKPFLGLGFIYKKTTVKATARLGKLNK